MSEENREKFSVVVTDAGDYSIWHSDRPIPEGWTPVGQEGTKEECLAFIEAYCVFGAPYSHQRNLDIEPIPDTDSSLEFTSETARSLLALKPGWLSRIFGLEPAQLVACDAERQGDDWTRGEPFTFLYRSRRHRFFVLRGPRNWEYLEFDDARRIFDQAPVQLFTQAEVFERPTPELQTD